ncbi:IS1182 family transposase [Carboxydochorda subterranea]|uniref:IS1182 family transposase n=1 Tax=Carboxydichorda subterranea TaxID=3109565 RepID=A0ABZ1C1V4_9FIRM|nr:IS1182 family transposase [Limnochorda sp. L945t]WRP18947.1 IS1182 family transposase [Limnochorda sp. L945t]
MVSLEELVPPNYILRRIDAAVDFSFIRQQVADKYDATWGRPSIDPELTLRLYTLAYLFNLSERGVCRETQMHAGFRWFCRLDFHDPVPDHSTLVKTRQLWGRETFQAVLRHVVAQCIEAGLVDGRKVGVDGTQVQANAAITSLEPLPQPIPLERYIRERLEPEETTEPAAPDPPPSPPPRKAGDPDFHGQRFSNATHRSTTDPDARLYCKGEHQEAKLRYLVHNLVDWKSRVILDTEATRAEGHAEPRAALQMLDATQALPLRHGIDELQADKGYASKAFCAALLERGIRPRVGLPRSQNHPVPIPTWRRSTRDLATYRKRKQKVQEALAHNAVWALQSAQTRRVAERQREICEHLFAEAKQWHGLDRARGRGLGTMQTQAYLTAFVQNLKRLVAWVFRRRPAASAHAWLRADGFAWVPSLGLVQDVRGQAPHRAPSRTSPLDDRLSRAGHDLILAIRWVASFADALG